MNLLKKQLKLIQKIIDNETFYNYILNNCTKKEFQDYQILLNIIDIELTVNSGLKQ